MAKYTVFVSWNGPTLNNHDKAQIKSAIATRYEGLQRKEDSTKFNDSGGVSRDVSYKITKEEDDPASKSKVLLYALIKDIT